MIHGRAAQLANGIAKGLPDYLANNKVTGGDDLHPMLTPDMVKITDAAVPVMTLVRLRTSRWISALACCLACCWRRGLRLWLG